MQKWLGGDDVFLVLVEIVFHVITYRLALPHHRGLVICIPALLLHYRVEQAVAGSRVCRNLEHDGAARHGRLGALDIIKMNFVVPLLETAGESRVPVVRRAAETRTAAAVGQAEHV